MRCAWAVLRCRLLGVSLLACCGVAQADRDAADQGPAQPARLAVPKALRARAGVAIQRGLAYLEGAKPPTDKVSRASGATVGCESLRMLVRSVHAPGEATVRAFNGLHGRLGPGIERCVRATAFMLLASHALMAESSPRRRRLERVLVDAQRASGYWGYDTQRAPSGAPGDIEVTTWALLALTRASAPAGAHSTCIQRATAALGARQNRSGHWEYIGPDSGESHGVGHTFRGVLSIKGAIAFLDRSDAWADLASEDAARRSLDRALLLMPNLARDYARAFSTRSADAARQGELTWPFYTLLMLCWALREPPASAPALESGWFEAAIRTLLDQQRADGSWMLAGGAGPETGSFVPTCLALLCLAAPPRHPDHGRRVSPVSPR